MILIKCTTILLLICCLFLSNMHFVWSKPKCYLIKSLSKCLINHRGHQELSMPTIGNIRGANELEDKSTNMTLMKPSDQDAAAPLSDVIPLDSHAPSSKGWHQKGIEIFMESYDLINAAALYDDVDPTSRNRWRQTENGAVYMHRGRPDGHELKQNYMSLILPKFHGVSLLAVFDGHNHEIHDFTSYSYLSYMVESLTYHIHRNSLPYKLSNGTIDFGKLLPDAISYFEGRLKYYLGSLESGALKIGTSALIAIIDKKMLHVANVGDCRAVMYNKNGEIEQLSIDHTMKNPNEEKRIKNANGKVILENGIYTVNGHQLLVSRSLGDVDQKQKIKGITAEPSVSQYDLSKFQPQFIIMASHGLWNTFSNVEAVDFIKTRLDKFLYGAKSIAIEAFQRGSSGDTTVMVINLTHHNWNDNTALIISKP